ncbi:unnamed protein product [Gongylonema pulchrum]|uniref:Uncharacterized protein n=1 Tax=Gongylonema pulchrum TaxID=637853 RepID=A0A3P7QS98_9BILA|nr:unnamed protein product [Gongylonema pulchrum]
MEGHIVHMLARTLKEVPVEAAFLLPVVVLLKLYESLYKNGKLHVINAGWSDIDGFNRILSYRNKRCSCLSLKTFKFLPSFCRRFRKQPEHQDNYARLISLLGYSPLVHAHDSCVFACPPPLLRWPLTVDQRMTVHKLFSALMQNGYSTDKCLVNQVRHRMHDRSIPKDVALYDCALNLG